MAKKVLEFFDGTPKGDHGNSKYPWNQWGDGNIWEITLGTDFDCKVVSMRGVLYSYAKRAGLKLQAQCLMRLGKIRFKFYNEKVEEQKDATEATVVVEADEPQIVQPCQGTRAELNAPTPAGFTNIDPLGSSY